jgi:hypothetical protein
MGLKKRSTETLSFDFTSERLASLARQKTRASENRNEGGLNAVKTRIAVPPASSYQ